MRPIKFRGRDIRGKILFGDLRRNNGVWCMFDGGFWYEVDDDGRVYLKDTGEVVPDMRAKLLPDDFTVKPA